MADAPCVNDECPIADSNDAHSVTSIHGSSVDPGAPESESDDWIFEAMLRNLTFQRMERKALRPQKEKKRCGRG